MAKLMTEIEIDNTDVNKVAVATTVSGDKLTGTVLENKQVFDRYPDMIVSHFNDLCVYVGELSPAGDGALDYTTTEITNICSTLNCSQGDITM